MVPLLGRIRISFPSQWRVCPRRLLQDGWDERPSGRHEALSVGPRPSQKVIPGVHVYVNEQNKHLGGGA